MDEEKNTGNATPTPDKTKKIKKVERYVLSVLLALVIAAGAFVAGWFGRWGALGKKKQSLLWAIDTAQEKYYKDIDENALYDELFAAFSFDRYSTYYTQKEYETVAAERDGVNRDAGFSVYGEESHLEVYDVMEGSSAAGKGITSDMRFWKFGKTKEDLKAGSAEDYFAFLATLGVNEKYYVLCGESEKESEATAYEVVNSGRGVGFSISQDNLQVQDVISGSSAEIAGIQSGMYLLKFGKTEETLVEGTAEDYLAFVAALGKNEKYYVLCGVGEDEAEAESGADDEENEKTKIYEAVNSERGAGISLTRKYDPMRVYQVVGNSSADLAGVRRGMYILKYGASANAAEMVSGSSSEFFSFINTLTPDADKNVTFHMLCSFDKSGEGAKVYSVKTQTYQATYCYYRDNGGTYRFRGEGNQKQLVKIEGEEPLALPDKTAYIALTEFTGNAAKEFKDCLELMKKNGCENLVLDLRGNGGGYMDVFVEIASYLLKETTAGAQKVAYAKFKSGAIVSYSAKKSCYSDYFGANSKISVLADEYTASASECLIGALVDYKTIGFSDIYLRENENGVAKTYGKGIMQTHYDSPNGDILKLTSAEIFWPLSNKTIHDKGVLPSDGAHAIPSSLLPDEHDSFLQEAIRQIYGGNETL